MPYSSIEDVKVVRLGLSAEDNSCDQEILQFISQADSMIDETHRELGLTPATTSPELLRRISADIAADLYLIWNSRENSVRESLWREIREILGELRQSLISREAGGATLTGRE
ncbi:MAG: hypothetical protein QXT12_04940 [Nitrososphaerota archaeon]